MPPAGCRRRSAGRSAERDRVAARFGRLLVTGGAGFIGSCYVRDVLGRARRDADHGPRQADLRRQRGEPRAGRATTRSRPRGCASSAGDIADPDGRRAARRRGRRGRQLRRRVARRPLDPRAARRSCATGVIGVHVLLEAVPRRARTGRASCRSRPTRSTARSTRATPREDDPLAPALAVRRGQGGRRAARPELRRHPRRRRRRHPRLEHVRAVPPPREAHPAVHHQRARRPAAAALRRRPPAARLAVRRRPRRGDRLRPAPRRDRARPTTSPGGDRADEPRRRRAAARPARQAVVAGPAGRGPARPRPALRDGRHEARGPRLAPRDVVRGRAWPRPSTGTAANEAWWRAARSRRLGRLLRAPVRPAARDRPGARPRRDPPTDARRRHGRRRPARASALVTALADAPFTGPAGPIAWDRAAFDLDAPDGDRRRVSTATGPRSSSTPRPGPTSTAAPATRSSAMRRNGDATGVLAAACADARHRPARRSRPTRSSTGSGATASATARPTRRRRPTRTAPRSSPASGRAATRSTAAPGAALGDRPDGLAVRAARPRLPEQDPRGRRACRGRPASRCASSATSGARRPTRADVADAIVELLGRGRRSPASTTSSTACSRRAPTGRATSSAALGSRSRSSNVPMSTWERASTPPRWGVLEPTPLPSGEPLRVVARRDGRLRAAARCASAAGRA